MADKDTSYIVSIEKTLKKEGFDRLTIDRAVDVTEAIQGFIETLADKDWDPAAVGYGG